MLSLYCHAHVAWLPKAVGLGVIMAWALAIEVLGSGCRVQFSHVLPDFLLCCSSIFLTPRMLIHVHCQSSICHMIQLSVQNRIVTDKKRECAGWNTMGSSTGHMNIPKAA